MINPKSLLLGLTLVLSTAALPVGQQISNCNGKMNGTVGSGPGATSAPSKHIHAVATSATSSGLTAAQLIAMAPATSSCAGADFPAECADATHAAPAISKSFTTYGFENKQVQAALIAIMLYESANFKYSKNHFPGRPGQGTRNMQMENFNKLYATDLKGAAAASTADILTVANADDDSSFGSAAWFLKTQCPASIAKGLEDGSMTGWDAYLTQCVQTEHSADRDVPWTAAKKVFGV